VGPMTRDVCTRWYKSVEMLFGSVTYTDAVDLWAVGCILAELLSLDGETPFQGGSDLEQLCVVFQVLGTVRVDEWPEATQLPDFCKVEFAPREPAAMAFESHRSQEAVALMYAILRLNPDHRLTAAQALDHLWFCNGPAPAEPSRLLAGLPLSPAPLLEHIGPLTPMGESPSGSEDSFAAFRNGEYEPVEIETTGCSLWGEEHVAQLVPETPPNSQQPQRETPSPTTLAGGPTRRLQDGWAKRAASELVAPPPEKPVALHAVQQQQQRRRTPSPPVLGGAHRFKATR